MSNSNIKNLLVDHNETIRNALKKINLSGLKVCFLVKNNKLKNVISDGDIRRSLLKSLELSDKVKYVKSKNLFMSKKIMIFWTFKIKFPNMELYQF